MSFFLLLNIHDFWLNYPFNDSRLHVLYCPFKSCMHASNIQARIRFSLLFTLILDLTNWVYINLVCFRFDSIGSKDNLVEKSGTVRQAF